MTDLELTLKALNEGILPSFNSNEIAALLETCDPEDARRMKRKFRKLWRKAYKKYDLETLRNTQEEGTPKVTVAEKSRRLAMVYRAFREDVYNHMKDELE